MTSSDVSRKTGTTKDTAKYVAPIVKKSYETTQLHGVLEIDHLRGVIYFHTDDPDAALKYETITILRICRLPTPIPFERALDITHMHGCDWGASKNTLGLLEAKTKVASAAAKYNELSETLAGLRREKRPNREAISRYADLVEQAYTAYLEARGIVRHWDELHDDTNT